ncbi:MAG: 30S ribosomal protein S7 [Firmicutes bacterium]|nr:30S ribosomal protein S7 [Bacillota bacterium]MDD4693332.1 30S ribosomal protein S7 [Bacillota bacterium]
MPRRGYIPKRSILPDPIYNSSVLSQFINKLMYDGKKGTAESIIYGALDIVAEESGQDALEVLNKALDNVMPVVEVKPRRVGGATYQVPVEVPANRRMALAMRWMIGIARNRGENTMAERMAGEILEAAENTGGSVRKKEDTHRMAEANRAFAHYRW